MNRTSEHRRGLPPVSAWEVLSTSVLLLDASGGVLWANPAAESLLGRPLKGLLGKSAGVFLEVLGDWFADGRTHSGAVFETDLERINQSARPERVRVRATLSPVPSGLLAGGDAAGAAFFVEVVALEDTLRIERDEVVSRMFDANRDILRNLAHEIKNPLGGIRGAAQLLDADLKDPSDRECTKIIIDEATRLQTLVDRFLVPYRAPDNVEPLNVHEILEKVRTLLSLEYKGVVRFERDYDISAPAVKGDRNRLTQVFLNLARNTAQALDGVEDHPDPRIRLKTRLVRDVLSGTDRLRKAFEVEVEDNGPGIPREMMTKIFYPLVTGRAEGTGLGLSIAQAFIHQAGGSLAAESAPGRTVFRVILPLADNNSKNKE